MVFSQGHALLIGVDVYRYASHINVPVASRDTGAVAGLLLDPMFCGYPSDQVSTLSGTVSTRTKILDSLDRLARWTRPKDTVFLFHSGHGGYDTDGKFCLICYDTQFEGEKVLSGTGISQRELLEKVEAIPAERLLWVFNACHSGAISPSLSFDRSSIGKNFPSVTAEALLSTGRGRVVITACREDQLSWIGRGQLSIFAQALVDGLQGRGVTPRGGYISLFDLYTLLYEMVNSKAEELVGEQQEPELTILKGVGPFAVSLYQGAASTNLNMTGTMEEPPQSPTVRQIEPERARQVYHQIISQTGGVNFGQGNEIETSGDVIGGDRIEANKTQGFIQHPVGPVTQKFDNRIDTGGGAYIRGNVNVLGGDFIGRDQNTNVAHSTQTLTLEDFFTLLQQLRAEIGKTELGGKVSSMIESEITRVEEESRDEKPSLPVIETRLTSIQRVIQQTGGMGTATIGLSMIIGQAIKQAQSLFN